MKWSPVKLAFLLLAVFLCLVSILHSTSGFPTERNAAGTANKGAFIPAFDEIVVESSLTVRGKSGSGQRQGKKLVVANQPITISITTTAATTTTTTSSSTPDSTSTAASSTGSAATLSTTTTSAPSTSAS